MPNILIMSAGAGAGHIRAAQAVELALRETRPEARVTNIDVLTLTNALFRRLYGRAYLDLVNKAPHVLGYIYDLMDKKPTLAGRNGDRLRRLVERLNLQPFVELLRGEKWDLVINTHFLSAEIIAMLKRKGTLSMPHATVTTDFDTHRLWANQPCERYFTASEEAKHNLAAWGVPADDIFATGIPVHPVFAQAKDRGDCCRRQGLAGDRPVVVQLAGGFGVGPIEKIYQSLLSVPQALEIVVITGRNAAARELLQDVDIPSRHRRQIVGFTDQMDEYLAAADLAVSKPGGLTTSETLARGAAMVIVDPIPGQEDRNSDYLLENGAAVKVNNLATLQMKVSALLGDSARLDRLRQSARRLGRPRAAYEIVNKCLELLE